MFAKNRRTEINKDYIKSTLKKQLQVFDYSKYALKIYFWKELKHGSGQRKIKRHIVVFLKDQTNHFFLHFCEDFEYKPILFNANQNAYGKKTNLSHKNVMMSIGPKNLCNLFRFN